MFPSKPIGGIHECNFIDKLLNSVGDIKLNVSRAKSINLFVKCVVIFYRLYDNNYTDDDDDDIKTSDFFRTLLIYDDMKTSSILIPSHFKRRKKIDVKRTNFLINTRLLSDFVDTIAFCHRDRVVFCKTYAVSYVCYAFRCRESCLFECCRRFPTFYPFY